MVHLEDLYRILRTGHVQAQGVVDTVPFPLLVLDGALCIEDVNRAFLRTFKVNRDDIIGKRIYDLGDGQWDIPELRRLLTDVIPKSTAVIDYKVEHDFPGIGKRTMLVTARTINQDDNGTTMLVSFVDASDRTRREVEFEILLGELRHRMKNLLGLVRALANQTKADGVSAEVYREAFLGTAYSHCGRQRPRVRRRRRWRPRRANSAYARTVCSKSERHKDRQGSTC